MILVQVPNGIQPQQIEFPEHKLNERGRPELDAKKQPVKFGERSCKGSLHLKPGSTKIISAPELSFIKKEYPGLRLHVIKEGVKSPEDAAKAAKPKPKADAEAKAKPKADAEAAKGKGKGGGSTR